MLTVSTELQPILNGVVQFISYMVLAVFAENVILARALPRLHGVRRKPGRYFLKTAR